MSTISLRLPDSLHDRIRKLSKKDHISINQFAATAIAEKISALETEGYLANRAKQGSRKKFDRALSKVSDKKPDRHDQMGA
ncbi:MAG: type II toxin-antitoxin system HicB family antitoxin [Verrucomicrobia bacterium]|nr:type II toxin-antitoxin system HicB family antitoxin [Verrucomicrobiota bacterium]